MQQPTRLVVLSGLIMNLSSPARQYVPLFSCFGVGGFGYISAAVLAFGDQRALVTARTSAIPFFLGGGGEVEVWGFHCHCSLQAAYSIQCGDICEHSVLYFRLPVGGQIGWRERDLLGKVMESKASGSSHLRGRE